VDRKRVVLFGTGQMASLVHFYLMHDSPYDVVAFTADAQRITEHTLQGLPVVPFEEVTDLYPPEDFEMSVPMMYSQLNHARAAKYQEAKAKGYRLINYVSSRASTWPDLVLGDNCFIAEGSMIQPFAEIGNDVIIANGGLVGHNTVIDDHCFVGPHAVTLGYVHVGPYCLLGANSTIRDGVTIGGECVIGAGVTIRQDTGPKQVFIGPRVAAVGKRSDELRSWLTWAR
jgi:sugar O-acyltransferase (sialic acid O-acetyltransferase NeuD family)